MSSIAWLVIGLICGIIEVATLGFWFLWLALAAILVSLGVKAHLLNGIGPQIVAFAVLTLLFIVFTRPLVLKFFKTEEVKSNVDSLVGETALVTQDILPLHTGQAKLRGEIWTAAADVEIRAGISVRVRAIEGVKLLVEPLDE